MSIPSMDEPPRVRKFRREIIATIPKSPNTRETKTALEQMHLYRLLCVYLSWRHRFIRPSKRSVVIHREAKIDSRWLKYQTEIQEFIRQSEQGCNLTPYLSYEVQKKGYVHNASRWVDKDFIRNCYGLYHLHLINPLSQNNPKARRSNDMLFVAVDQQKIEVHGIFDHSIFMKEEVRNGQEPYPTNLSPEHMRFLEMHDEITQSHMEPGKVYINLNTTIASDGTPTHIRAIAQRSFKMIRALENELDNRAFVAEKFFDGIGVNKTRRIEWGFDHMDLALVFDKSKGFTLIKTGY